MNSQVESKTSYSLAVIAVGTALVVLFAGAGVIVAVGHQVPQELWAAASVLSGALVGILIPTPSGGGTDHVASGARFTQRVASNAAHAKSVKINKDTNQSTPSKQAARAAVTTVRQAPLAATLKKIRDASTPASEVIDSVIGIFDGLWQDAHSKVVAAHDSCEAARGKRNDAQAELQTAQAALQAAQAPAPEGQQQDESGAAALKAKIDRADATFTRASTTLDQASSTIEMAQATREVHAAAAAAAADARATAATIADPGSGAPGSAPPSVNKQTILLFVCVGVALLAVLAVALWLAMEIARGSIHPDNCPLAHEGKTQGCDSNLLQVGTVLLSLASAAGGTLLGLFATPDGKPPTSSATSKGSK
jgi:hypothetical protein